MTEKILFLLLNIWFVAAVFGISMDRDGEKVQYRENIALSIIIVFVNDVSAVFLLSLVNCYSLGVMCGILVAETLAGLLFLFKTGRYAKLADALRKSCHGLNYAFLVILVIAGILYSAYPTYYMWAGRDPAIYLINGVNIAKTGSSHLPDNEVIDEAYDEVQGFTELAYTGIYSDYEEGDSDVPSRVTSQFFQYFSAVLAIGYSLAGQEGLVRVNALIGVLCLLTIYYFVKSIANRETGLIAAALLAFNPAQLWSSRITQTETLYQLFVFWGLYLFVKAWRENRAGYALAVGVILGSIGLNRIDSYLVGAGVLTFACYVNLWIQERKRVGIYLSVAYIAAASVSIGYSFVFSKYYASTQSGFKEIVILIIVLVVAVIVTYFLGRLQLLKGNAIFSTAMDRKWLRYLIFSIGVALFAIGYFWRPTLQDVLVDGGDFSKRALVEFCWYISVFTVPFFFYGLWKITEEKEKRRELLLFLAIGFSSLLLYIIRPSITPDHPWASRRWVSVAYPFVLIIVAIGIQKIPDTLKAGKVIFNPIRVLAVGLLTGYAVYQCQLFLFVPLMRELPAQYEELAGHVDAGELYFVRNSQIASILRFVYDKDVVLLKEDSQAELYQYLADNNKAIQYIGEAGMLNSRLYYKQLAEAAIIGTYVNEEIGRYPSELKEMGDIANVYLVAAVDVAVAGEGVDGWATRTVAMDSLFFREEVVSYEDEERLQNTESIFMYGPYWSMRAGCYALEVDISIAEDGETNDIGILEVTANGGMELIAQRPIEITDFENGQATLYLPFTLMSDAVDVEFRIQKDEACILEITEVRYCLEADS